MKLKQQVAIITGGGRGIGRTIALSFAAEGASLVLGGTTVPALKSTAREIVERGGAAVAIEADVGDESAVERLVEAALNEFGRIDILVNNAGIAGPTAPITKVKREDWDRVMAVNLTGAFLCTKHVLPHMMERLNGRIINITSVGGLGAYALRSPYSVSKWGMIGLTRTAAEEAGKYNITVNVIAPGPVRGQRIDEVIRRRAAEMDRSVEEVEREYVSTTALKRMVEEEDIAAMALFLASAEGRNITGETIAVSGGFRL